MFKKILALLLATMMVLGGMVTVAAEEAEAPVEEVVDTVDYDAIYAASADKLAALDILKGNGVDYALDDYVQRWHMALFVARIMSGETKDEFWNEVADNTTKFDDVDNYFGAIDYVSERGIVKGKGWIPGVGSNCFAPNESIILQDALTMVVRALGFKQLENYPDDFVAKAEALGLTAGLEELELTAPLTRGQMVQILTNTLFTEIDGTSFAKANFGLEEKVYVVVATEFQALSGVEKVLRVDYLDNSAKYVALAPLNADGTYDLENLYYYTEEELGLEAGDSELKLGYSYTASSLDGFETATFVENDTETFYNYGFDKEDWEIVAGSPYSSLADTALVKIDNKTYRLTDAYTELTNKPSYANKQPELIVHSMFESQNSAEYVFLYDLQGNILNPDLNASVDGTTLAVGIYYSMWNNSYYVYKNGGYQLATESDFAAYSIGKKSEAKYGIVDAASDLTTFYYSEIVMIDDNNDGTYDRGIYTPYSIGYYEYFKGGTNDPKVAVLQSTGKKADSKNYVKINGVALKAKFYSGQNPDDFGIGDFNYIDQAAINFVYEDGSTTPPANNDLIIYNYNVATNTLRIIENLHQPVKGNLDNYKQGTVVWDGSKFVVTSGELVIDGVPYKVGLNDVVDKKNTTYVDTKAPFGAIDDKFNKTFKMNNNQMGYLDLVHTVRFNGDGDYTVKYQLLDNRVIILNDTDFDASAPWVLFDYGYSKIEKKNSYTTYNYYGDILGIDEDFNIEILAYDSQELNGTKSTIKVDKINGYSFGEMVEDYAILSYQFSGVGYVTDPAALETMKKVVIKDFFLSLTKDLNTTVDEQNPENNKRQFLFRVESVNEADGSYNLRTDVNTYWGAENVWKWSQPVDIKQYNDIEFEYGFSTTKTDTDAGGKYLMTTDKTKVVIALKNKIVVYPGKLNDATLHFAKGETYTYALSDELIIIVAPDATAATEILETAWTPDTTDKTSGWTYYLVYGYGIANGTTISKFNYTNNTYTYKNLYNINKGTNETVDVKGGLKDYNQTQDIFKLDETYAVYGTPKPVGAIYANKGDTWELLTSSIFTTDKNNKVVLKSDVSKIKYDNKTVENCYVVSGSKDVLCNVLANGVAGYPGIFSEVGYISGAAGYTNMILLDGTKIDTISFAYDIINYKTDAKNNGSILITDGAKSTTNAKGIIFYDYTQHVKFTGTMIQDTNYDAKYEPVPDTSDLPTYKQTKIGLLDTAAGANTDAQALAEAAEIAIMAAESKADVDVIYDIYADLIQGVFDGIAADFNTAKTNAKTAITTAVATYDQAMVVDGTKTVADRVKEYHDAIDALKTAADDVHGYVSNTAIHINYLVGQCAAAKKVIDDDAAAEAAKVEIVKIENDTIYFKNLDNIQAIAIYTAAADTSLTVARFVKVNLAWTADADNATAGIKVGDSFKTNAMTDGNFKVAMVAEATADDWATGTISFEYTAPTGGTPAPIFVEGTTYRVVITNGTEPVTYIGIAG